MYNQFVSPVGWVSFADGAITKTTHGVMVPELWSDRVLRNLMVQSGAVQGCLRNYEDDVAEVGDVVHVHKLGTFVAKDKVAGGTVTLQNPAPSEKDVTLTNHKEVSFLVEDVIGAQADAALMDEATIESTAAIIKAIETDILGQYANAGTTINWDNTLGKESIQDVYQYICVTGKCPVDGLPQHDKYIVVDDITEILLSEDEFINEDYIPGGSLSEAQIGKILGFNIRQSTECITTTSPTIVHWLAWAREGIALATRKLPEPPRGLGVVSATVNRDGIGLRTLIGYNMSYLGTQVTQDILYGVKVLRPEWVADFTK